MQKILYHRKTRHMIEEELSKRNYIEFFGWDKLYSMCGLVKAGNGVYTTTSYPLIKSLVKSITGKDYPMLMFKKAKLLSMKIYLNPRQFTMRLTDNKDFVMSYNLIVNGWKSKWIPFMISPKYVDIDEKNKIKAVDYIPIEIPLDIGMPLDKKFIVRIKGLEEMLSLKEFKDICLDAIIELQGG